MRVVRCTWGMEGGIYLVTLLTNGYDGMVDLRIETKIGFWIYWLVGGNFLLRYCVNKLTIITDLSYLTVSTVCPTGASALCCDGRFLIASLHPRPFI